MQFFLNIVVSAVVIAASVHLAQRSTLLAAALVSLPLSSVLALSLLYAKTEDASKVAEFSYGIFWLVIPSLGFFLMLPFLIKHGYGFWMSLAASCLTLSIIYPGYSWVLKRLGLM